MGQTDTHTHTHIALYIYRYDLISRKVVVKINKLCKKDKAFLLLDKPFF